MKNCEGCPALCCKYIAMEIDAPENAEDFQHIRWFLMHENVVIELDDEKKWYIEFRTPCKNLDANNKCIIHPSQNKIKLKYSYPKICEEHPNQDCERNGDGEPAYEHIFTKTAEFEEYIEKNLPKIINKKSEEDTEDVPLLVLNDKKIEELIKHLQKLKEKKEFDIEDSQGDTYAFEYKN